MFSRQDLSKLDVLESKLNIYEELSRDMLEKLEKAVNKISESNNRIATILTKHDERIEQSNKADALIIKMIQDLKEENTVEHARTGERVRKVEEKAEEYSRVKWMTVGIGIFGAVLATAVSTLASGWLTPGEMGYKMEHRYVPIPENVKQ
jgi:hypothetical protein